MNYATSSGSFQTSPSVPYASEGDEFTHDDILYDTLTEIFRDLTNGQIKKLIRSTDRAKEDYSLFKMIQRHQPALFQYCPNGPAGGLEHLSLLWICFLRCYERSIELLVRSGADVNKTFGMTHIGLTERSTVLHAIVLRYLSPEHERLIQLMTDNGADLAAQDYVGETVLHLAVRKDRVEVARIFLDNGANVSAANLFGDTPLALVSDKNANNPMVKLLIKALALQKIDQPTIELKDERLMEEYPDLWDYYQDCIEHGYRIKFTKFAKNCTFMQLLLQCPCDIATLMRDKCFESNFDMYDLYSFGMYAEDLIRAYERAQNFSRSMLQLEKTINTAFQHFVDYNVVWKGVRYLSKCCCRKMTHRELVPLLDCAVVRNHVELTEMFLQNGADVNVRIAHQAAATPLLLALERHNANVQAPMLLKHGANVWAKDKFGLNALHYVAASTVERPELARLFIEKGISLDERGEIRHNQPIHLAAERGRGELVNLFADHGADVNSRANESPEDDTFPLYLAAACRSPAAVEALLKRGANVNMKTKTGRTALHKACQLRLSQNIKLLLAAGADVLVQDNLGKTPFALFTRTSIRAPAKRPITDIIKALAKRKACQPQIEVKDEEIMKTYNQRLWNSYQRCIEEVHKTRSTRIVESCTFFQLLTKDSPQIATLMRNPEFEVNFQLYDLQSEFPMFAEDITEAYERAQRLRHFIIEWENTINEAMNYAFPDVFVRNVVRFIVDSFK